ncbi:peptidoglycan recognition protein 1-like [Crassostrea virginica]
MMDGNLLQRLFYPQNNGRFKKALITSLVSVTISLILKFSERSFLSGPSDPARGVARCSQFDSNVSLSTENLCVCSDKYQAPDGKSYSGCRLSNYRSICFPSTVGSNHVIDIGNGVNIYTRHSWCAREPKGFQLFQKPARLFFIHHTAGHSCHNFDTCVNTLKGIQNFHMDNRGWDDIGYSFLIGQDGQIYEGRGWDHVGAHTKGFNTWGYAVSFMGNYMAQPPNNASLNAARTLIEYGKRMGYISSTYHLYGHRDMSNTSSPGDALYPIIQFWPHYRRDKIHVLHDGF